MKLKHVRLVETILDAAILTFPAALGVGLATMVSHVPGSDEYLLRWEPAKLVPAMVGWLLVAALLGRFRYRAWRRSHDERIASLLRGEPDPAHRSR